MANPVFPVATTAGAWTKVATNVTTGILHKKKTDINYWQTYRMTGEDAPTTKAEAVKMFVENPIVEQISSYSGIDVYVWSDEAGVLRVDV